MDVAPPRIDDRQPLSSMPPSMMAAALAAKPDINKIDVTSLEYVTFRVPYEEMNMKFRNGQKEMEKATANVARASAMITELTANATAAIPKEQLARKFEFLMKQVRDAKNTLDRVTEEQIAAAEKIKHRCQKIGEEIMVNPRTELRKAERLERQRHARYIIWHLLRCGQVPVAREMVDELEMHEMIDIDIFENIHDIQRAMTITKSTGPALQWIELHKSKLKRLGSRVEIVIRRLDVFTMIQQNKVMEAIVYVKKYITPIAKAQNSDDLKQIMSAIACPPAESAARFPELHGEDRFEKAADYFIKEVYRVYEIRGTTPLAILIQCGIAAFKSPYCQCDESEPKHKLRCFVCRPDIWPIAENLPYAHVSNNRILCSMSNELCNDDDNKPYMFPSGHVFGAKTIEKQLKRPDNKVWDPVHKQLIEETEVLRLYFL